MQTVQLKERTSPLKSRLLDLEKRVGDTPIIQLTKLRNVICKSGIFQFGNSIKMRPALYILKKAIQEGQINEDTTIIESSSGNFGIALAMICKYLKLNFIVVIDKNTPEPKEELLRLFGSKVVKIEELDETGGYLLNRLKYIANF